MLSLRQSLVPVILCGMVLVGQLPAWMHLAECTQTTATATDHDSDEGRDSELTPSSCSDSCCGLEAKPLNREGENTSSSGSEDDHHEDSCFICQSLSLPNGFTTPSIGIALGELVAESSSQLIAQIDEAVSVGIPESRGPPAILS